jgi:succinate-semialdehyde dehydrogenase / glutarate-semialdehyde dehydrogenase
MTITQDFQRTTLDAVPTDLLIGAGWTPAEGGRTLAVENPATGEVLAEVADASPADALAALDAADQAREQWAATPARERAEMLRRAFDAVIAHADRLSLLMTLEMGKPLNEARAELTYGAEFLRWYSEEAVRIDGRYAPSPTGESRLLVSRQAVGPCLLITPWNFPLAMATRKVAPALAAGCTAVLKPAALTPLTALAFAQLMLDAGLPPGVLNVVTTSRAGEVVSPLLQDGRLRKVSFTGSTGVGQRLLRQSADRVLRTSMELGGNAPFIVLEDAHLDAAVDGALLAKMRNTGQSCVAANRLYVHESLADSFAERLAARMDALVVGRGTDPGVEVGPLIDGGQRDTVASLVDDARTGGAAALCGGEAVDGPGYFYRPTVLVGAAPDAKFLSEEVFGPVAPIVPFDDDDEVIALANATEYGLVAYLYTGDLDRGLRMMERLETGMVGINRGLVSNAAAPFGGMKSSGLGREGGLEGIEEYLETKYAAIALNPVSGVRATASEPTSG